MADSSSLDALLMEWGAAGWWADGLAPLWPSVEPMGRGWVCATGRTREQQSETGTGLEIYKEIELARSLGCKQQGLW